MNHQASFERRMERLREEISTCSGCGEVDGCVCIHVTSRILVSDCCGANPVGNGDFDTSELGICSECKEHCEYIPEGE